MNTSEQTDKLIPALAKAQNAPVKKNAKSHNNKYADLKAVSAALEAALEENGLAVIQTLDDQVMQADQVAIITRIWHIESGQWIESRLAMLSKNPDPQGLGSAITYGRRYSLLTMFGLTPEDDDAEQAMGRGNQIKKPQAAPRSISTSSAQPSTTNGATAKNQALVNANKILSLQKQYNLSNEAVLEVGGIPGIKDLIEAGKADELATAYTKLMNHVQESA